MKDEYNISEVSSITGVNADTIQFYERSGFLGLVNRLPEKEQSFSLHQICQVKICHLVFSEFANKDLRKKSCDIILASSQWNLPALLLAIQEYQQAIEIDIRRTKEAIHVAMRRDLETAEDYPLNEAVFTKRQVSQMVGVTIESIRNWERNDLVPKAKPYQKNSYSRRSIGRMHVIKLLMDTEYSIRNIKHFFKEYDEDNRKELKQTLFDSESFEDLWHRTDRYLKTLERLRISVRQLLQLYDEMRGM